MKEKYTTFTLIKTGNSKYGSGNTGKIRKRKEKAEEQARQGTT